MIDDLDQLRHYMEDGSDVDFDLSRTVQRFKDAVEADAQGDGHDETQLLQVRRRLTKPRRTAFLGAVGAVAVVVLLITLLLPNVGSHQPVAAAAELRQIATNAASQSTPELRAGQYLLTEERVSLFANIIRVGSTPTPYAQATVTGTIKLWTDQYDDVCMSSTSSSARFSSSANQSAWTAAGLLDSPRNQPSTSCGSDPSAGGGGVIDVSKLPTDPATLSRELRAGTTNIPQVDQLTPGQNPGFERAAILLVGPTTGATPTFNAALYNALALIPGVKDVGNLTTHSGAVGIGFAATSSLEPSTIIINPSTGAFLEARNFETPLLAFGIGPSYLAPPPTPSIYTEGGSFSVTIQWLDPVGSPSVVAANSLPAGLSMPPPSTPPAEVTTSGITGRASITGAPADFRTSGEFYLQVCPSSVTFEPACQGQIDQTTSIPNGGRYSVKLQPGTWQVGVYYWATDGQIVLGNPVSLVVRQGSMTHQSLSVGYAKPAASGTVTLTGAPSDFAKLAYMGVQACPSNVTFSVGCANGAEAYENVSPGSNYSINLPDGTWTIGAYYRAAPGVTGVTVTGPHMRITSKVGKTLTLNLSMSYQGP